MTPERWAEVRSHILEKFPLKDQGVYELEGAPGRVEFLEFDGPGGLMRIEWVSKPKVIDTKVYSSKRIGSQSSKEYVYSQNEKVYQMHVYRLDTSTDEWVPLEGGEFFSNS